MTIDSTIDLEGLRNAARIMHEAGRVDPRAAMQAARRIGECFPTAEQAAQNLEGFMRAMREGEDPATERV